MLEIVSSRSYWWGVPTVQAKNRKVREEMLLRKRLTLFVIVLVAVSLWGGSGLQPRIAHALTAIPMENNGLAKTPFMGWSTWHYIGTNPTEANVEAQARAE